MDGWSVFYFICYLVGMLLFLFDAGCRLSSRVRWNSTWMTPAGLFCVALAWTFQTGRTLG
jgi:hypothetical protein